MIMQTQRRSFVRLSNWLIRFLSCPLDYLVLVLFFLGLFSGSSADASNTPIAGTGCTSESLELDDDTEDLLFPRRLVLLGEVDVGTPLLDGVTSIQTRTGKHRKAMISERTFLKRKDRNKPGKRLADRHMLLVNATDLDAQEIRESPVFVKALSSSVPILLENLTSEQMKALTGLGLTTDAVLVQAEPGGRRFTITGIDRPASGVTKKFVLHRVNRALANRTELPMAEEEDQLGLSVGDAYATKQWTVYPYDGNIKCQPPYDKAPPFNDSHDTFTPASQTGSVNFGIQITLVAGASDDESQKAIDILYTGSGGQPLAEGHTFIEDNDLFKGAQTLAMNYDATLTVPPEADLNTSHVEPSSVVKQHKVTKTNGWAVGLSSSCGANATGPNCSIGASFNFSSSKSETENISERDISAESGQSNTAHGYTEATHSIEYVLGATAEGTAVDPEGDWNSFFKRKNICVTPLFSTAENYEALALGPFCFGSASDFIGVRNFPAWTGSAAMTEGEAGYTFDGGFTGDLSYDFSYKYTVGIFAFGWGLAHNRGADFVTDIPFGCDECPYYTLRQYRDTFSVDNKSLTIASNDVNFSGLPTCKGFNLEQKDLGVWKVTASTTIESKNGVNVSQMALLDMSSKTLFQKSTYSEVYGTLGAFGLAVSAECDPPGMPGQACPPVIKDGQTEYVALCSSDQTVKGVVAMALLYSFTPVAGSGIISGSIGFDGAGNFVEQNDPHITVDKANRSITISD